VIFAKISSRIFEVSSQIFRKNRAHYIYSVLASVKIDFQFSNLSLNDIRYNDNRLNYECENDYRYNKIERPFRIADTKKSSPATIKLFSISSALG